MNGSCAAILGQNCVLGGGAPVAFHSFIWPSSSAIMAASISLASFLRSAEIDLGIAQPQMSSQAEVLVRLGPRGDRLGSRPARDVCPGEVLGAIGPQREAPRRNLAGDLRLRRIVERSPP